MKNTTYKSLLAMVEQQQIMIESISKYNNALKSYIEACIDSQKFKNEEKVKYNDFKVFEDLK